MIMNGRKKIWIDFDNSPHVPFFKPIIDELERLNYSVLITARDSSQTCELADLMNMKYTRVGGYYGKHKLFKIMGSLFRVLQLAPFIFRMRPDIAVSHGSRTQQLLASILKIPNIMIFDYEHTSPLMMFQPTYIIVPEVISNGAIRFDKSHLYRYPGIKEDVYVSGLRPDPYIREVLGLKESDIVATIRPPASAAHYRSPESEKLFSATIEYLASQKHVKMVMLPRYDSQAENIRKEWAELCSQNRIIIPEQVVDGLNLIWASDFVVSGGGTMNREAAALGVPVYSIFRGTTGAVDKYLSETGRLILLESVKDVRSKIKPIRRNRKNTINANDRKALKKIVSVIEEVAEKN